MVAPEGRAFGRPENQQALNCASRHIASMAGDDMVTIPAKDRHERARVEDAHIPARDGFISYSPQELRLTAR